MLSPTSTWLHLVAFTDPTNPRCSHFLFNPWGYTRGHPWHTRCMCHFFGGTTRLLVEVENWGEWKVWCHKARFGDEVSVKHVPWTPKHHQTPTLAPQLVLSPSLSSWLQFLADLLWHSLSWNPFFPCCPSLHHQKPWCITAKKPLKLMKSSTLNPFATKELVECCQC